MKSFLLCGIVLLAPLSGLFAQDLDSTRVFLISGKVTVEDSSLPVPNAHVYVANTTYGDITANDGAYEIRSELPGSFLLVVTSIGYSPFQKTIRLDTAYINLDIQLAEAVYEAGHITVEGEAGRQGPLRRRIDLSTFKKLFLGTTENRQGCKILNPEVIQLIRIDGSLQAWSDEPIIVENRSLGFKVHYLLQEFSATKGDYRFRGEPFFELLTARNEKEANKWVDQQKKTFEGSFQHFLRSLANNNLQEDGFVMYAMPGIFVEFYERDFLLYVEELDIEALPADSVVAEGDVVFERKFFFNRNLHVFYKKKNMPRDYFEDMGRKIPRRKEIVLSALRLETDTTDFNVSGFPNEPFDIGRQGFWGWEVGICNWLPFGYRQAGSSIDRPINAR